MDRDSAAFNRDDLCREIYCILGIPIDAIEMPAVLRIIDAVAKNGRPFLISTPNLNFLVNSLADPEFRESLWQSDLCPPDGMPILWIARLLGVPINKRIAGSDIFEALKLRFRAEGPLKIFLFGATEPVAAAAAEQLNYGSIGLKCVGWACPGFGNLDELSKDRFISQINASNADFLVAALGARNGQAWLLRNHFRLQIPIRAHLGATVNFQAGSVKRAPYAMRRFGLEWLWRIKEEPRLFKRYWHDGGVLLRLLLTHVLPLAAGARWRQLRGGRGRHDFVIVPVQNGVKVTLHISGDATAGQASKAISFFRDALSSEKPIAVDLSQTRAVDARFFGLFLMLRKQLKVRGFTLQFIGVSPRLKRQFRLNGLEYLLSPGEYHDVNTVH
jgi:N-acetylglucosaminyldiphosphoundecaprenol N-acetyl-beta-D-mannosaminyltransferase